MSADSLATLIALFLVLGIIAIGFGSVLRSLWTGLSNRIIQASVAYLVVVALGSAAVVLMWRTLGEDDSGEISLLILFVAAVAGLLVAGRVLLGGADARRCPFCEGHGYVLVKGSWDGRSAAARIAGARAGTDPPTPHRGGFGLHLGASRPQKTAATAKPSAAKAQA